MMDAVVLEQLVNYDPHNNNKFRFNPYESGIGILQFNGGPFYFGAGDSVDALPPDQPIPGLDVDGVVYVNYGGKLLPSPTTDIYIDTVIGRRTSPLDGAGGLVLSPRDQVHYLPGGLLQDYGLDFAIDKATSGIYENNIVVTVDDPIHAFDVPKIYESSTADSVKSVSDDSNDE
jgi:hypothetical protein